MKKYKSDQSGFSWGKQGKELEKWRKKSAASKKGAEAGKAKKEYNQLKKAIEAHQKNGRTLYDIQSTPPTKLHDIKAESERMKRELKNLGAETRQEAKNAPTVSERKRLNVRARLDEEWGPNRERLKKILAEIHEKDKDSRVESDYEDFWTEEDTVEVEEDDEMEDDDNPF